MVTLLSLGAWIGIGVAAVAIIIIISVISWNIKTYNKLVQLRNRVDNSFSQIDVQLKKRFDLIPNLVETVKGYAKHENSILNSFADARKMYAAASSNHDAQGLAQANNQLSTLVNMVTEQYPEIKADKSFIGLQKTLHDTEDKIALSRQFYNDVCLSYNNAIALFPSNIVARTFRFDRARFFEVSEMEREAPHVR